MNHTSSSGSSLLNIRDGLRRRALYDIIEKRRIHTVFQPIVQLDNGSVYAYEALSRIDGISPFSGPEDIFNAARNFGMTANLEKLCRRQALLTAHRLNADVPITLNVSPAILNCPDHEKGMTVSLVEELFLVREKVILELTEKCSIENDRLFRKTVEYYRDQGFRVAVDDLGAGYAGLNMLIQTEPFMVKIDRSLISGIDKHARKRMLIESLVSFCSKINALVVAEGVETENELDALVEMKVDLGQGYLFGKPLKHLTNCGSEICDRIVRLGREKCLNIGNNFSNCIESLVRHVEPASPDLKVSEIAERFKKNRDVICIPVTKDGVPRGVVHKNRLFYKLGRPFGYDLLSGKPVKKVLEPALVFESGTPLEKVAERVLNRTGDDIYDAVIVARNGVYIGTVTIRSILERITDQKIKMAMQANPLSGLPGNAVIENEITKRLAGSPFAVMYFDLDNFKPFNDNFGFEQGDRILRFLANLLAETFDAKSRGFVGHVGGDDFVAVCESEDARDACDFVIRRFDSEIRHFHDSAVVANGYYESRDRFDKTRRFGLLSLSVAVVKASGQRFGSYGALALAASGMKKQVKKMEGSVCLID